MSNRLVGFFLGLALVLVPPALAGPGERSEGGVSSGGGGVFPLECIGEAIGRGVVRTERELVTEMETCRFPADDIECVRRLALGGEGLVEAISACFTPPPQGS